MKNLLLSFFLLQLFFAQAQFAPRSFDDKNFQSFLKTKKTYVMITNNAEFDSLLKVALQKYWKLTPFEMVHFTEMQAKMDDPSLSFMMALDFPTVIDSKYGTIRHPNNFLGIVVGGKKEYYVADMIAFTPLDPDGDRWDVRNDHSLDLAYLHSRYRLKDMIAGLNHCIELVRDNKYEFHNGTTPGVKFMLDKYGQEMTQLKGKTLYILEDDMKHQEALAKVYPYKVKLVNWDDYTGVVNEERKGAIYLLLTHNEWGGIQLIDPSAHTIVGGLLYSSGSTIDERDIKDVAKLIEKAEKEKAKK